MADTELAETGTEPGSGPAAPTAPAAGQAAAGPEPAAAGAEPAEVGAEPAAAGGAAVNGAANPAADAPAETWAAAAEPPPAPVPAGPGPALTQQSLLRGMGIGLLLLAVFVLGFAAYLYGLSGVQEARTQTILYTRFQAEVGQVGGIAPPLNPPIALGSPVIALDIPSVGIKDMVVVQGTSPENLRIGPGHRPDTPLPGQAGVVQIYGRRATFGAPFAPIANLRPGDIIKAITAQGTADYKVAALAYSSTKIIKDTNPDRLLLLTASSPVLPSYYLEVDADLISKVQPDPGVAPSITSSELPLKGDGGSLVLTMVWGLALAGVSAAGTLAAMRWSPWVAYLVAVPVALAVLLNLYQNLSALLPNLY